MTVIFFTPKNISLSITFSIFFAFSCLAQHDLLESKTYKKRNVKSQKNTLGQVYAFDKKGKMTLTDYFGDDDPPCSVMMTHPL